jgi:hypothetical protein
MYCPLSIDCCIVLFLLMLYCPLSIDCCIVLFLLTAVLSSFYWLLYCPLSIARCIVLFLLTALLSSFYWPLYCPLSTDRCIVLFLLTALLSSFEIRFLNFPFDILILSHTIIESCSPPLYEYLTMASIIVHHSKFSAQIYFNDLHIMMTSQCRNIKRCGYYFRSRVYFIFSNFRNWYLKFIKKFVSGLVIVAERQISIFVSNIMARTS